MDQSESHLEWCSGGCRARGEELKAEDAGVSMAAVGGMAVYLDRGGTPVPMPVRMPT